MNSSSQNGRATRSSLACLPCRSRHLKCGGERPCCARCAEFGKQCNYAESRRGGLNRAALVERRKRLAEIDTTVADGLSPQRRVVTQRGPELTPPFLSEEPSSYNLLNKINIGEGMSGMNSPAVTQIDTGEIEKDSLVDAYYENFHKLHPFVPPQRHFTRLCQDLRRQVNFTPLIAAMRLIGHIFKSHEWSMPLKDYVETCFSQTTADDPIMVQCRLLYSIALFWYDYKAEAKAEMDHATRSATDMQMFLRSFSTTHGANDPVFQECWRRTWWMLYLLDGYYTGTLGNMSFTVVDIDATVDLPCEESEYESGVSSDDSYPPVRCHRIPRLSQGFHSSLLTSSYPRQKPLKTSTVANSRRRTHSHPLPTSSALYAARHRRYVQRQRLQKWKTQYTLFRLQTLALMAGGFYYQRIMSKS